MSDYEIIGIGAMNEWRGHFGGFSEQRSRDGRRVVDHELDMQYIGMTANSLIPGEEAGYWHAHSEIEEMYVFLEGEGEMGLDDDVIAVAAGSVVRVGQNVRRTWRCTPNSPTALKWLCIRAGEGELDKIPTDAQRDTKSPMPW